MLLTLSVVLTVLWLTYSIVQWWKLGNAVLGVTRQMNLGECVALMTLSACEWLRTAVWTAELGWSFRVLVKVLSISILSLVLGAGRCFLLSCMWPSGDLMDGLGSDSIRVWTGVLKFLMVRPLVVSMWALMCVMLLTLVRWLVSVLGVCPRDIYVLVKSRLVQKWLCAVLSECSAVRDTMRPVTLLVTISVTVSVREWRR